MNATELYRAGRLDEAIQALGVGLRDDPADVQRRIFLFELLCFAGQYERAEKQLDVLALDNQQASIGAILYRSAIHAQRTREDLFSARAYPQESRAPEAISGMLNGEPFESLTDADPRIGARLEVFAAGQYTWIPLRHIASIRIDQPRRLRDLLWVPAAIRTGPDFQGTDLGEVLLPVLTPLAARHTDNDVRLGRLTTWEAMDDGTEVPVGQKMLFVDGSEVPILEVRELEITAASVVTG